MFKKIVAIEPLLCRNIGAALPEVAREIVLYGDMPGNPQEVIRRIGDADAVLVSYTTPIGRDVLEACGNLQYIGMCCSLYDPGSANVDIVAAGERGITVRGVRDYGDNGVVEYVVGELVRLLHGFGGVMWKNEPLELTGIPVGIVGMGTTGSMIAEGLRFFGAEAAYYSRTRKPQLEDRFPYYPLHDLLARSQIACTCLNRNVVLLGDREFASFGDGKILVNISIGPGHEIPAASRWLDRPGTFLLGDTYASIGDEALLSRHNVICAGKSAGATALAATRLEHKVLDHIREFLRQ